MIRGETFKYKLNLGILNGQVRPRFLSPFPQEYNIAPGRDSTAPLFCHRTKLSIPLLTEIALSGYKVFRVPWAVISRIVVGHHCTLIHAEFHKKQSRNLDPFLLLPGSRPVRRPLPELGIRRRDEKVPRLYLRRLSRQQQ